MNRTTVVKFSGRTKLDKIRERLALHPADYNAPHYRFPMQGGGVAVAVQDTRFLLSLVTDLAAALRTAEWSAYDETGVGEFATNLCPECNGAKRLGHEKGCSVGGVLARLDEQEE